MNITIVVMEGVILALFWIDIGMEIYHKQFWKVEWKLKFSLLFQMKLAIISLLTVDSLVYYPLYKSYPVRLFRITRPCTSSTTQFCRIFTISSQGDLSSPF